jgi:nucleotide-binding universal stress UspA family protein
MSHANALRTIVVATDFSENAQVALGWAKEIARQHGARLLLAHAAAIPLLPTPEIVPLPAESYEEIGAAMRERLARETAEVNGSGVAADCELVIATPATGVVGVAERHGADLIVAGTRGRTGWKRALLGSTAARLVRQAPCPVLTVHPHDAGAPRPVRTILVPTDFSHDAALAAQAATRILGEAGPDRRLLLVHAYRVPEEATHLPATVLLAAIREAEASAREQLEKLAASLRRPGLTIEVMAEEGYAADVILERARVGRADLIAMGTHGRSGLGRLFIGSTAERVLPFAPCPVLTVHRE